MKTLTLLLFFLAFFSGLSFGADLPTTYETCSQVLIEAEEAGAQLSPLQVSTIVSAANPHCLSSAETSEWLNEVLFSTLLSRPDNFIEAFSKADSEIKRNIITELGNPIHDGIDLQKVYSSTSTASGKYSSDKQSILTALKSAGAKAGLQLQ